MNNHTATAVKSALDNWNLQLSRLNQLLDGLSDDQLLKEVAPGRNRGVYLLGHLASVHDRMLPLLHMGSSLYPELESIYIQNPDNKKNDFTPAQLREAWKKVNEQLNTQFAKMDVADWFHRHDAISEEDFKNEPHRNKLNVLMNRTGHLAYHYGQMIFLKK
ncbi:MAG: DinB family protein [Bacteroidetes bacterium]|nr:MAG: DinB family protein [Bacteroidota bacterium]